MPATSERTTTSSVNQALDRHGLDVRMYREPSGFVFEGRAGIETLDPEALYRMSTRDVVDYVKQELGLDGL